MQGLQLEPGSWKSKLQSCSQAWKQMSESEQDPYMARAAEEQALRESAALEPFSAKEQGSGRPASSEVDGTAADLLCRNAKKTISKKRVIATYGRYKDCSEWQEHDGGLSSADGALRLDLIDLVSTDDKIHLAWAWTEFARSLPDLPQEWKDTSANEDRMHHSVCHVERGICKLNPFAGSATKLVHSFADLVSDGTLLVIVIIEEQMNDS